MKFKSSRPDSEDEVGRRVRNGFLLRLLFPLLLYFDNEAITELHKLIRKDHEHMDVILHQEINKYASEEMLGKILADIQEEIDKRKR